MIIYRVVYEALGLYYCMLLTSKRIVAKLFVCWAIENRRAGGSAGSHAKSIRVWEYSPPPKSIRYSSTDVSCSVTGVYGHGSTCVNCEAELGISPYLVVVEDQAELELASPHCFTRTTFGLLA
jgi:hypothetical protein